jgi:membrane-associated protein
VSDWLSSLLDPQLDTMGAATVYVVLFGFVFVETGILVGFFLPGDSILFTAGLLSAEPGTALSLPVLVVGVTVSAIAGDTVGYWTGKRLGRPWLDGWAGRRGEKMQARLREAEAFYERWGQWAVVIARFIPWVRTFTPILAGVAQMPYRRFLAANVVGALFWGAGLVTLGHLAYSVPWVKVVAYTVAGIAILGSFVVAIWGWVRGRRARRRREQDQPRPSSSSPKA